MRRAACVIAMVVIAAASSAKARPRPGALYAALFRPGAHWRYRVTERGRAGAKWSSIHSSTNCEVVEVRPYPGGVMSRIECDTKVEPLIARVWIEDARGLWRVDEFPRDVPDLREAELVIEAAPAERCARLEQLVGEDIDIEDAFCFDARGIVSASSASDAGGNAVEFELR